jgi:hypothetical protein
MNKPIVTILGDAYLTCGLSGKSELRAVVLNDTWRGSVPLPTDCGDPRMCAAKDDAWKHRPGKHMCMTIRLRPRLSRDGAHGDGAAACSRESAPLPASKDRCFRNARL